VRGFLQMAFAVAVISGWFLLALWMVLSVIQIGVVQSTGGCTVQAGLEVYCAPHP